MIVKGEKRATNGWGGRVNYTYSRLMDNQFGETNFMQPNTAEALNAYDLTAEYSLGLIDVPHKLAFAPIVELPFGRGKRWAARGAAPALLAGWTISSVVTLESGFPIAVASATNNTNLFTQMQRPNPTGEVQPLADGDHESRLVGQWLDPNAYSVPMAFTLGTAPRTEGRVRGPHRNNVDMAVSKSGRLRGRLRSEFRVEAINLTNTVKVIGPIHTADSSGFGQIRTQSGFMRIVQFTFQMSF